MNPPTRRDILRLLAVGASGGVAGCMTGRAVQAGEAPSTMVPTTPAVPTTTTATELGETTQIQFAQGAFRVRFTCRTFSLDVRPPDLHFYLFLQYLDTRTNERIGFVAGPLTGHVEDPFGETEFVLLEAEISVHGEATVAVHLPDRCRDGPLPDTRVRSSC